MGRRVLVGTVATLGLVALVGLFAALSLLFSSPIPAYAQGTNSAPEFSAEAATREVAENSPAYHDIGLAVTATDDDGDRLTYSIKNARTSPFTIVRSTGQLQVGQPLDHEDDDKCTDLADTQDRECTYTVVVQVTDSEDADGNFENPPTIDDTITVTITVNNVEEAEKVSLSWKQPQVDSEITASLTDLDSVDSDPTWQWASSNSQSGTYSDLSGNGATPATYTPQSGDANKWLRATASYTDGQGVSKTAQAISDRAVREDPPGNTAPAFRDVPDGPGGYSCSPYEEDAVCRHIPRNTPVGGDIYYPVRATDPDGDEIRYSLDGTDADLFRIDPFRGELFTTTAHAFNDERSYAITIIATDPSGEPDSITITLMPSGGTHNPVVSGPEDIVYPENGTWQVAEYLATTADQEKGYTHGWLVSVNPGGGDGDFFRLDDDGRLTFIQPPDFENPADEGADNTYEFSIEIYHTNTPPGKSRGHTVGINVTVTVVDVPNEALEIDGPSAVRYAEHGTGPVANYSLTDRTETVQWVLSGDDGNEFNIGADGALTFNESPDYENPTDTDAKNDYLLTITAYTPTDAKTEFVRVQVTDVNEPPEFDEGTAATRSVDSTAEVNKSFGDPILATDPDDLLLTYRLPDDNQLPFGISPSTGQLWVDDELTPNKDSYLVTVEVTDGADAEGIHDPHDPDGPGGSNTDDTIIVTVNVDGAGSNNAPAFPAAPVTFSFNENPTGVVDVGTPVAATDGDSHTLSYTLGGTDGGFFTIVSDSGQIQTKTGQTYDFETKPSYLVTVTANDGNGGTADKAVTITLNNVEEDGTVTLSPTQPAARSPVTATLTDPDGSISGTSWQWAKSSDGNAPWADVGTNSASYTPPDADVNHYLRAIASYTDGEGGSKTATATTTQKVQTGTNRPPTFDNGSDTTREVAEDAAANANVGDAVEASDSDGDDLAYSLTGQDAGLFTIETGTGQVKVKTGTTLDYEGTRNSYTVVVRVTDSKNAAGVTEQTATTDDTIIVTINVTDANEASEFDSANTSREVAENTTSNTEFGDPVAAEDPDSGDTLIYALGGTNATSFDINTSTGRLKTKAALDKETKATYSVIVEVRDRQADTNADATIDVTITVTDVNEKPAFTETDPATRNVPENTSAGHDIGNAIAATDPDDGDTLIYSLDSTSATSFSIDTSNGQLKTKAALNKEATASYTVTVSVKDRQTDTNPDDTITVTITVTDANEPPEFPSTEDGTRSFPENTAAGENIGVPMEADDPDTGATLTYSLEGTDKDSFTIVPGTGQIQTKLGVTYDHEAKATHSVTVKADDGNGGTDTIDVTINITDVNEAPEFPSTEDGARSIAENTAASQPIGDPVEADDPDDGDTLTYTLGGTDASSFDIDTLTGQLKTKAALDKEDKASYTVTVSVRDSKNDAGGADVAVDDEITVTITVTGENDPPEITGRSRVSYAEDRTDAVANYTATDPEGVTAFTWSLSGDDEGDFSISNTGELTFQTPPDHEAPADADTNNIYLVTVRADDGNGATDTFGVTVTVADVNEPPLEPGKPTVLRASSNGVSVTWSAPNNTGRPPILRYLYQYKKNAEPGWSGATHATNGPITSVTIGELDAGTSYDVEVRAINDEGPGPWSAEGTGSTNNPPAFSGATAELEVPENTVVVTSIGVPVTATDGDLDTLSYTLEGADANSFHIVSASGQIETKSGMTYDHEAKPTYTVRVKADDSNGGTDTIDVTITVTDVNEAPAFDGTTTARDVPENTGADTGIGSPVEAEDPDAGATLTYSLGGTDASSFDIDTSTGQLKTKDALDHETNASYTVIVSVHDGKNAAGNPDPATDDEITVTITVTDANDPPEFDPNTATREVAENTAANINIGSPVRATDADNDTLTYTLEGTDHGSFSIDELSGQLKTKSALDHEAKESYTVRVKASDGNDGVDTIDVTITVTDVNEPPDFDSETATRNVPENTAAGDPVGPAVPAVDPDDGDSLTYSLGGTDSASFGINGSTGQITVGTGTTPDFETKLRYEVTVTATDSSNLSDTITVTINVTEGNDPPAFATDTATRRVAENTPASINLGDAFSATDADNNNLTYTLEGTDAASFDIVSTSGQLQTKAVLDYEVKSSYSVTVKAADASANGTIDVTITVTDVNEPPLAPGRPDVSEKSASSVSVTWTAPANQGRPAIMGYDYQYKKTDEPTWSGATYATTGVVTSATISGLDSSTSYDVQARAKNDEGTGSWSVTGAGSTGNTTPAFSSPTVTRDVAENTPADVNIGDPVAATDDDNGDSLTYTLGGVDAAAFDIDSKTGQLKTKALLDREGTKNTYTVMVTATDSASATAEATVTITVTNVNELPAFLPGETGFRVVNENTAAGQNIGVPVGADDPDTGDTLTYTLDGTDAASFAIVASTGQLKTKEPLDYETKSNYSVTVSVSDGKDANGGVEATADATIPVTIVVDDMNEPPVFDPGAANRTIAENTAADRDIGSPFTATDPDDYTLSYSLGGTDAAIFRINASTGQLQTRGPLDHETKSSYTVTVSVHDGKAIDGTPSQATDDTVTVTITVTDVEEDGTLTLSSVQPQVDTALTATLEDPDGSVTITTWLWESSSDKANWTIISGATGAAYTPAASDVDEHLRVTATYTDSRGQGKSASVTSDNPVRAAPSTNTAPTFSTGTTTRTIAENTEADEDIGTPVSASDSENDTLTYSLSGTDAASFGIVQATGQLLTKGALDFEAKDTYTVTVTATDPSGLFDTTTVTITVIDVNEAPSVTVTPTVYFVENGTGEVATYMAADPENSTLTWKVTGVDSNAFSIDGGVLTFKTPPDYENPTDADTNNVYMVTVEASDGPNTDDLAVTITVTDVDEPPLAPGQPVVSEESADSVSVTWTAPANDGRPAITGYDYQYKKTDEQSWSGATYAIPGDFTNLYITRLDASTSYDVQARAKNDEGTGLWSATGAGSTGNTTPAFSNSAVTRDVAENTPAGINIGYPVAATDDDNGDSLTYTLGGADAAAFDIDSKTGQLKTKALLDREAAKNTYTVIVTATDSADATDEATVTITVTDVNELPAFLPGETGFRVVNENTDSGQYIGVPVGANDPDSSDTLTYTLGGTNAASFAIVASTGQLQTNAALDYETKSNYSVTVSVSDGKDAEGIIDTTADATIPVTIVVDDVNEPPKFDAGTTTRTIAENTAADTNIGAPVRATDPDDYTLSYSLGGTDAAIFRINASTGQLQTRGPLDHEAKSSYTVTVSVHDGKAIDGTPSQAADDTVTVTITVTDVEEDGTLTLSSVQPQVDTALTATLTDPDGSVTITTWLWESSSDKANWTTISGATDAAYMPVTGDVGKHLQATARYTDSRGQGKTASVTSDNPVRAAPPSNAAPTFSGTSTARSVEENTVPGANIGTPVTATDSNTDKLTYSLGGTDAGFFDIDRTSGQLLTKAPLDYEDKKTYSVTVTATDPSGLSDTIEVTITVTDVNEAPAVTVITPTVYFVENASGPVATYGATDPDGDTVMWDLATGSDSDAFSISSTGVLTFKTPPDYENPVDADTNNVYMVTVEASDGPKTDDLAVTITVTDVDEPPLAPGQPVVSEESASSVSVTWTAPANDGRPAITGYDYQYKKTDEQSWSGATYAIPGDFTNLYITRLDASTSYEVQARAKNDEGTSPWSATGAGSTGNTTPDFSNSAVPREVAENTPANVNIGYPVTATDDDNGDSLTYTLGGTDATSFDIDSKTGQLKTKADVTYDHETDDTYMVIVTATDSASATAEATVTITVTNVNEPPSFGLDATDRTVAENTLPGDPVGLPVSAEDDDVGDTLTYSMAGADSASFGIDSGTGLITVGAGTRLDFESGTRTTYEVTVTATDSSHLSTTITVTIEVLNVDESGVVTLSQLQPQVDTDLRASLDDPDGSVSGLTWEWEISSDGSNGWAAITGGTTASYTPVSGDVGKFLRVTASYSDGEGATKTAQAAAPNVVRDAPATNDAPEFPSSENGNRTVAENTGASENVGAPVTATDSDSGDTLTYKLSGADASYFSIVDSSGQIQTKAPLDHEAKATYTVTVTATDPSGKSDFVTVTITVTDLNEPPLAPGIPAMTQNTQTSLTMAWTAPGSTGRPAVTDYDYQYKKTAENTWTAVTNTPITDTSVEITGLETTTSYHVQVRATNDEGTGDWSDSGIGVTRTQPNTPPEFPGSTTERHVTENTEDRQNVGNPVDARDTDNDDLTYILEGTDADSFMIDDESGQLKTKMPLDHEVKDSYSVLVKAEDGRGGSDTIGVTIKVTNVNESPEFSGNLGVHSVLEKTTPGVDIGAPVTATDPENDTLTYSLDSAGAQVFDIDASTGQLRTKAALDYETARVHSVTVYVSDRRNTQGETDTAVDDDISVTITVTNVNEPPAFTEAAPSRSVAENSAIGADVGTPVTATDPEVDTLTYSLDGTDKDFFSIDRSSGQLKTGAALDFESGKRSYSVTVSVSDGKNAAGNTDTAIDATVPVTIAVTDENEAPEVTIRSTVRYAENDTDPVDTYTATDPERGTITWTLPGTDMDDFRISKVNDKGVLEFRTPPNYEAPADTDTDNIYLVTVEVSDGNTSDALEVTVTVFNVNEPPAFPAETGARNVDENTAAGQNLGDAVAAVDPERDTLIYKLAGTDGASFAIDTATGQLRTRALLDYETKSTYLVTVHVRDSLDQDDRVNAVTDDTINITITITNIDEDGWIVFSSRQPQIGTPFTATIEDPDGRVTGATWAWENSSNGSTNWATATGTGATSASYTPVAADSGKYLRVTASYTDGHDPGKTAQKVSDNPVRVTPDSNVAPTFASSTATRGVDEGTAAGQNIGDPVSATDADPADGSLLTYSLTGPDAASFEIVRATGQLLTKAPLDHEDKASYTVTVTAVDPSLMPAIISVTINVNDVDEPPVLAGPDVVDYPENGTDEVETYIATDPEGVSITWSLEGDDKDLFNISGGELTFIASPDHDAPADADGNNIYMVTVTASDGTTPVTLDVEVTVSNVNEAPEFPAAETGDRTVAENTAADVNIGDPVAATDPDNGDTLTYTLGGIDATSFSIDETTGQLKTKDTLNYEAKDTYTVTVTATDSSGLSATIGVTVTVSSVNEAPEFPGTETGQRSVAENTPAAQDIGAAVGATDPDTGDTLTYTLEGDDAASFAIGETTGQLKTRDPLDYETKASYAVTVSVSDGKDIDGNADPSADNTIDVTISVTNVPEAGTVILSSLQPQVGTPITARLEDPDDATNVNWTWESSSNWSSGWTATSGAKSDTYTPLDTYAPVAGDLNKYLRATATYTNSASAQVSAHGVSAYPVRAAPAPGSNAAPAFATLTATRSVPEDTPVGSAVGDPVAATDTNADDVLTYSLSGADAASFTIGMASGQLRTKAALDHDTKASYMVVVTAADPSGLSDTITVTISVTDQNEPPVISGKASVYYAEDRTDTVATYTAIDPENGSITWSLAGEDSGDFSISNTGVLTFNTPPDSENPADADTNNVYLVTVQASDGTNTSALDVTVTVTDAADPPPAPDAPTVEAAATDGHTAFSVSWQAPVTTGGSPITGYEVEYRKQGTEDWSSGENVTINGVTAAITGVLPDTLYEVQVRAENADGWGAWSEPGTGRTDVTPLDQQVDLTVSYRAAGYTVNEGATRAVSVTLSEAADRALQIPITVAPLTAEPGDYRVTGLTNGALAFVPGDSSKRLTFEALQDTDSDDEAVSLGLGQLPAKVSAGTRPTTVVTIDDDDPVSSPRRRSGGGGGGGGGSGGGSYGSSSPANKAPVFTEGTSASRSVTENTATGVNIGAPVTATDADKDTLTYTVGGDDGSAFAVDRATGQLKTKSALDFETKSTYRVTMGVFDPTGGSDTITVTITVTDVADVSLVNGTTQMIGVVDSERDTTVSTLDGSVAVTFPSGSQSGDYQVRLDHGLNNCNPNFANEELWFCLTVDIFDNEGNLEQGVVLSRPATIKIRRNGDERGGVDAVLGLHAQGGVSVYTRGRTGGEWTESAFTLESDGVGGIVITITGVSSFGLYAGTTDSSVPVQVSHQVATVPVPTATPQNTGGQESSPEPTPTPTPTPQPGSSSEQSTTPDPTPTPAPVATQGTNPTPEPTLGHQVSYPFGPLGGPAATPTPAPTPAGIAKAFGNLRSAPPPVDDSVPTAEPEVKVASFDSEGGKSGGMPSWYIAMIMLALAATIAGGSTYFVKRRQRLPYPVTVQRSREFYKWWSGW